MPVRRIWFGLASALLLAGAAACIPEMASWSGDGNRLAFVRPADNKLYVWDHARSVAQPVNHGHINFCRFNPVLDQILFGHDERSQPGIPILGGSSQDPAPSYHCDKIVSLGLSDFTWDVTGMMPGDVGGGRLYDFTADGSRLFFVHDNEALKMTEVMELDLGEKRGSVRLVHSCREKLAHISAAPSGRRMILEGSGSWDENVHALAVLDTDSGATSPLVISAGAEGGYSAWLGESRLAYMKLTETKNPEEMYRLEVRDLDSGATRTLASGVLPYQPPSLSRDRRTAAVTCIPPGRMAEFLDDDDEQLNLVQVGLVDCTSGGLKMLTHEPLGAAWPALDPAAEKVSYLTPAGLDAGSTLRVLEPATGRRTLVRVDEEDRMLALAEGAMERGDATLAVESLRDLLARFPETRLKGYAGFLLVQWSLSPSLGRRDEAFDALAAMTDTGFRREALRLFWSGFGASAEDPSGDWITRYANDDTSESFGFDTDLTRDLLGLRAGTTRDRLYLQIEYASGDDVTGVALQDTLVLFDLDGSSTPGSPRVTDAVEWDHRAEYGLRYRHWEEGFGDYDVEMLRGGEAFRSVKIVGALGKPDGALGGMRVLSDARGARGLLILALDLAELRERDFPESVAIQVCTLKGGVDDGPRALANRIGNRDPNLERARRPDSNDPPVCDIADAFGSIKERKPSKSGDAPCLLTGSALTLKLD